MSGLKASTPAQYAAVNAYYEHTEFDYRVVWHSRDAVAFHFGYYETGVHSHYDALVNTNRVVAKLAHIRPGDKVLDAGCGHGATALWLARHIGCEVCGISPIRTQIDESIRLAAHNGLGHLLAFDVQSYTSMSFPDDSFDVVVALESLCHADVKISFYREASRVLRPGGRLVVAEYMLSENVIDPQVEVLMKDWLDGWSIPNLDTAGGHQRSATQAGFSKIEVIDNNAAANRSLRRLYKLALLARPIDYCLYVLGFRNAVQHGNVVASLRQYQLLRRGTWFYGILTGTKE